MISTDTYDGKNTYISKATYEVVGGCDCCGFTSTDYRAHDSAIRAGRALLARLVRSGHANPWVRVYDRDGSVIFDTCTTSWRVV